MSSLLDRLLPEPSFVVRDPEAVTRDLVRMYEDATGLTLYPAQVERIMVDIIAYRESLQREAIQDAAKLNLVRYSRAPVLDFLGENIGVPRLEAAAAVTTLRFTFDPVPAVPTLLPAGTQVDGGSVSFTTSEDAVVPAGAGSVDVAASCTAAGVVGNGFVPGQIKTLAAAVPGLSVAAVQNTTTTADGAEEEDDENFRERIVLAPGQFSTAGSIAAYRFFARSAHQTIKDVAVVRPVPGEIALYPLVETGLPSAAIKDAVAAACSAERVRPLCDTVGVHDPVQVDWRIEAQLVLYAGTTPAVALAEATKAANAYVATRKPKLGLDTVRTQVIDVLSVYGVYRVDLIEPAADQVLSAEKWANCTDVAITIADVVEG